MTSTSLWDDSLVNCSFTVLLLLLLLFVLKHDGGGV